LGYLYHDGTWTINFSLTSSWQDYQAIWIFEDIRNAWIYVHENNAQYDPGPVTAVWERNTNCYPLQLPDWLNAPCGSFAYGGTGIHFIFVSHDDNTLSMDVVVHETAHMYMVNANQWWYTGCTQHWVFNPPSNVNCAWAEGWADFLPLPVNNSQCYNRFSVNSCQGQVDFDYFNLETHIRGDNPQQFNWGDTVEGRVAGALYDLYDYNNEGFDRKSAGFLPIAQIALDSYQTTTYYEFFLNWIYSCQDSFASGLTLWWNTISYINIRLIYLPVIRK
jgi:hypothetical protein